MRRITMLSLYKYAGHNDVSVNDGQHIRRWSHYIILYYIILYYIILYYLLTPCSTVLDIILYYIILYYIILYYIILYYIILYYIIYLLTPFSTVLLEKLTGLQLVKKFPSSYGTRRFITSFTSARHLSLSWASPIHSILPHPTSWRSIYYIIL